LIIGSQNRLPIFIGAMKKIQATKNVMPHPATQLIVWVCGAIVVQKLQGLALLVVALCLLFAAYVLHDQRLFRLLRRARWILFTLFIIYALLTSGEPLWPALNFPSLTIEGVSEGLNQLGRLICVLASLSILLTLLSTEQLLSGIYSLMRFVRYVGLSPETLAVRLALTLHYAESAMRDTADDWRCAIQQALSPSESNLANIDIALQPRGWGDTVLLILSGALLLGAWR
jgi:energy-coupling factor transport system permease protein